MHIEQQEFVGLKLFCHDIAIYTVYIIHVIIYMYMYVNASITIHQHSCSSAIHAIDNGVFAEIDVGHLEKTNNFTIAVLKDEIQWNGKCTSIFMKIWIGISINYVKSHDSHMRETGSESTDFYNTQKFLLQQRCPCCFSCHVCRNPGPNVDS